MYIQSSIIFLISFFIVEKKKKKKEFKDQPERILFEEMSVKLFVNSSSSKKLLLRSKTSLICNKDYY